jgi:rod shape-determining protein MreC
MLHRQTFLLFAVISVGHVLLISAQVQSKTGTSVLQSVAFGAFASVQGMTSGVAGLGRSFWTNYLAVSGAARENEELRRRLLDLEAELQRQRALAGRTQSLEQVLALKSSLAVDTVAARVIAGSPSPGSDRVTIDRGRRDGMRADLAVIADRGVVGRIINPVADGAATVQLLLGSGAAAAVVFERSSAGGVARGGAAKGSLFRVDYVSSSADIQAGERVLTSGQDGIYPQGFMVGTVERIERGSSGEREILVRPAVDFSHIDLVLVVVPHSPDTGVGGS